MTAPPIIAIVDDDAPVRHALGQLLRSFDFAVQVHGSGQELLESATLDSVSCLITDVHMPAMNGFALCEALRDRGLVMPVIFMTAFIQEGHDQRAKAAGAICFLNKPFQEADIMRCIAHALLPPEHRAASQSPH